MPTRDIERAVYAALILAGEPVNNRRLAELMGCSPDEASRQIAQLVQAELGSAKTAAIRKARGGREVLTSLH
jgi:chromosome segregation and condensation protein ScpB